MFFFRKDAEPLPAVGAAVLHRTRKQMEPFVSDVLTDFHLVRQFPMAERTGPVFQKHMIHGMENGIFHIPISTKRQPEKQRGQNLVHTAPQPFPGRYAQNSLAQRIPYEEQKCAPYDPRQAHAQHMIPVISHNFIIRPADKGILQNLWFCSSPVDPVPVLFYSLEQPPVPGLHFSDFPISPHRLRSIILIRFPSLYRKIGSFVSA